MSNVKLAMAVETSDRIRKVEDDRPYVIETFDGFGHWTEHGRYQSATRAIRAYELLLVTDTRNTGWRWYKEMGHHVRR